MNLNLPIWEFCLVLGRTGALILFFPMLIESRVPHVVRAGIAMWVSLLVVPLLPPISYQPAGLSDLLIRIFLESVFGLSFAFGVRMVFTGVLFGAQWIDMEMGFGAAAQMNPLLGVASSPISTGIYILMGMSFWVFGTFENLLAIWVKTFQVIPPPLHGLPMGLSESVIKLSQNIFWAGIQLATPMVLIMFLISVTIGMISRSVQGVNLFVETYNITLLSGMIIFIILFPFIYRIIQGHLAGLEDSWKLLIKVWRTV